MMNQIPQGQRTTGSEMLKKILIDADTGIDDSIAILFALKRPDVRVMGVTTGFGNTTADRRRRTPCG